MKRVLSCQFVESDAIDPSKAGRFKVILLKEGLGNLRDAYWYSKEAISSAVPIFEGKKIYADHPSAIDEESRPERSVKDIVGHFENLGAIDVDGQSMLEGEVVIVAGESYAWARDMMAHAVEYSKKYKNQDFIGLSINASGDAEEMPIDEIIKIAPKATMEKLALAKENGIDTIRVTKIINDAVSCDLVTNAGAGGRVIQMLGWRVAQWNC